jgi:hypothetical protein
MAEPLTSELRGLSSRGIEENVVTDADRAISPTRANTGFKQGRRLEAGDRAIVDEAFLRDASVGDAMGVLFLRALSKTREHYVSSGILERLNQASQVHGTEAGDLRVSGTPWLAGDESRRISPNALVGRMLCERHNVALSNLDIFAFRLFTALDDMDVEFAATSTAPVSRVYLFNGHLERWMLKVLCGLAASGNLVFQDHPTSTEIPSDWIEVLFGARNFLAGQGLYVSRTVGGRFEGPRGVGISGIGRQGRVAGVTVLLNGYELVLLMATESDTGREFFGKTFAYRPLGIHVTDSRCEKSLLFSWDNPGDAGTVHVRIGGA